MKIKNFDAFAWIWWFSLALQEAIGKENIETIWFSEIDKFAIQTYQKNFPWVPNFWDISKIDIASLPDFDLLTGGFPCQDVSVAGKQSLEWGRTILVEYLLQMLEIKKPKYFVFENVKGLMSKKFNTFRNSIFDRIVAAGYEYDITILNTRDFWIPQNRERVFIVWSYWSLDFEFPKWKELQVFLKDILEDEVKEKYYLNQKQVDKIVNSSFMQEKLRLQKKEYCDTLLARDYKDPKCIIDSDRTRKITPIEYERLQWFPDNWTAGVSNSQRYKQCWNSVSIPPVRKIFKKLFKELWNTASTATRQTRIECINIAVTVTSPKSYHRKHQISL